MIFFATIAEQSLAKTTHNKLSLALKSGSSLIFTEDVGMTSFGLRGTFESIYYVREKDWLGWPKGQIISKWCIGVFDFLQKTNENKSISGIIVVKSNSFVRFLEEIEDIKTPFEIN